MRRLLSLMLAVVILAGMTTACERTVTITGPTTVDTVFVPHVDTLRLTTVDTVTKYDTVTNTVTVPGPVAHDSIIVVRVDTVTRVDTLTQTITLPGTVVHDSTWVYVQANPTNPLGGGDYTAGVAYIPIYQTFALVFWHGNFVGVVQQGTGYWRSYIYVAGQMTMPTRGDFPTLEAAVLALVPISLVLAVSH